MPENTRNTNQPLRIVFSTEWFLYYSIDLVNALVENGCEVFLITRDHSLELDGGNGQADALKNFIDEHLDPRIRHRVIEGRFSEIGRSIKSLSGLASEVREFSPDLIHVQQNRDWRVFFLTLLFFNTPRVYTVHDVTPHPGELRKRNSLFASLYVKCAHAVIVHGKSLLEKAIDCFGKGVEKKLCVIPHGLLTGALKWDDPSIKEEPGTILCFGRMNRYKGLDVLARSILILKERGVSVKPILVGQGHEKINDLLGMDSSILGAEVHERYVAESEIAGFFRRASVVVFPYIEASQSGVVTLAYVFSKPIIVTSVGALPEVVVDGVTGMIVPPRDAEELANALEKLITNEGLRQRMGIEAGQWSKANLSWEAVAKKTISLYEKLIKK